MTRERWPEIKAVFHAAIERAPEERAAFLAEACGADAELARIYILVGETEKALDALEPLLRIPYYLSPGWLKIDPTFNPLRGKPRFERLIAG
jgi:hypothetical protein